MHNNKMTRIRAVLVAAGMALSAVLALVPISAYAEFPPSFAPAVEKVKGAVVNIATTEDRPVNARAQQQQLPPGFEEFFRRFGMPQGPNGRSAPIRSLGSGFIIDPAGYIVTNNHVVANATEVKVTLQDGSTYKANVVGKDPGADLALIKVDAGRSLPSVSFGDSDKSRVGDWVISVGNPFGLGWTVTAGIISATGRDQAGLVSNAYVDFLQIDAPINQGNSGGPTFNSEGEVIGVNSQILSPNGGGSVGIGFAIPANIAKPVIDQLKRNGKVARGWLGVAMQPITPDMEEALGLKSTKGVVVNHVVEDGPAAKAGIRAGDVIVSFGNTQVGNMHELGRVVANTAAGTRVPVSLLRDGKTQSISVTIEDLKPQKDDDTEVAQNEEGDGKLGLNLAPLDQAARQQYGIPKDVKGVVVAGVRSDSAAAQKGIRTGDVLVSVDRTAVEKPADATNAVDKAEKAGKKTIAVLVSREGTNIFVALPLGDKG